MSPGMTVSTPWRDSPPLMLTVSRWRRHLHAKSLKRCLAVIACATRFGDARGSVDFQPSEEHRRFYLRAGHRSRVMIAFGAAPSMLSGDGPASA